MTLFHEFGFGLHKYTYRIHDNANELHANFVPKTFMENKCGLMT